ncbi:MAG TPA: hypothetical protein DF613_09820 [Lachnospiraceae bacterium]|nr:hypothetical protein [Lachnospiraceae bacterium]
MILSASRRTDIPNYYFDWFCNRLREGYLYVRNPMNERQVSHIDLSPEVVDCIVFWTKNPRGMPERLSALRDYSYYVQFTLTGYGRDVEPGLPDKPTVLLKTFQDLSRAIGAARVVWRYDPILFTPSYTPAYHVRAFEKIAEALEGYTKRVVISFVDLYAKIQKNMAGLQVQELPEEELLQFAERLAAIAEKHRLVIETCAEAFDLEAAGIRHGSCIDARLIEEITGCRIRAGKDKNQRKECGCIESVEVGTYNTCRNGCRYCYANFSETAVKNRSGVYDPYSPFLCGVSNPDDKLTVRKMKSLLDGQIGLFDGREENG